MERDDSRRCGVGDQFDFLVTEFLFERFRRGDQIFGAHSDVGFPQQVGAVEIDPVGAEMVVTEILLADILCFTPAAQIDRADRTAGGVQGIGQPLDRVAPAPLRGDDQAERLTGRAAEHRAHRAVDPRRRSVDEVVRTGRVGDLLGRGDRVGIGDHRPAANERGEPVGRNPGELFRPFGGEFLRQIAVQVIGGARVRQGHHPFRVVDRIELLFRKDRHHRIGMDRVGQLRPAGQPAEHPADRGVVDFGRIPVSPFDFNDREPFGGRKTGIDPVGEPETGPRVVGAEEVVCLAAHQGRFRRAHDRVILMIHPERHLAEDILFRVLRIEHMGQVTVESGQEAAGRGTGDTVVERHQIRGLRPASAVPRHAEPVGDHVVARLQIVERAGVVPILKRGGVPAEQHRRGAEHVVRRGSPVGHLPVLVEVLEPFPLFDRVEDEHRQPVHRAERRERLVVIGGFPVLPVSADNQETRIGGRELFDLRQEHRSGGVEVRLSFENDLFDPVFGQIDRAGHLGIERGLLPEPAEVFQEEGLVLRLVIFDIINRFDVFIRLAPRLRGSVDLPDQFLMNHKRGVVDQAAGGQNRAAVGGSRRAAQKGDRQDRKKNRKESAHIILLNA